MNKNKNGIDSKIWNKTFQMLEEDNIDFKNLSKEEQLEIQENLKMIDSLKSFDVDISPSIASFNSLLEQLPDPLKEKQFSFLNDWKTFFKMMFHKKKTWAMIPVLGMMTISFMFWKQEVAVNKTFSEATLLSQEIESDFELISRELLELETIEDLLVMSPKNTLKNI